MYCGHHFAKLRLFALGILMTGCAAKPVTEYATGKVYRVTGNPNYYGERKGTEFMFAVSPPQGDWYHTANGFLGLNRTMISFEKPTGGGFDFRWHWGNVDQEKQWTQEDPLRRPWDSGATLDFARIPYQPTEGQLLYGTWSQPGYRQKQWQQYAFFGAKRIYCFKSLDKTNNRGTYNQQQGQPIMLSYGYTVGCPYRLTDGRVATFVANTGFGISPEQLAANPNRVDENITIIDNLLQHTFDTLEVMPQAYQFNLPKTVAQQ